MKKYTDEERKNFQNPLRCYDCHALYSTDLWIEIIIPDKIWEVINPTYHKEAGILCHNCIDKRLSKARLSKVPAKIYGELLVILDHEKN